MKVVFDTNIFISAFVIPKSKAEQAYLSALDGKFALYTSVAILTETARILETKFKWPKDRVAAALLHISSLATVKKTRKAIHLLSDEPDNRILECAAAVEADCIVTGDKKIPEIKQFNRTRVIALAEFLRR